MPSPILAEAFEYADLAALQAAGWTIVNDTGGAGSVSMDGSEVHEGNRALRIDVSGAVAAGKNCYAYKTFGPADGLAPFRRYGANLWTWENEEGNGPSGIACGVNIVGGDGGYVEQDGTVGFWQDLVAQGTANADGQLVVQVGFFHSIAATYSRIARFDDLRLYDLGAAPMTLDDILYDAGLLFINGSRFGVSRGGLRFNPQQEWERIPYDGDRGERIAGLDRLRSSNPIITGTILPVGDSQLAVYVAGGTVAPTSYGSRTTPPTPGTRLSAGQYLTDVVAIWPRGGGGFVRVIFPVGYCSEYELQGEDKATVGVPITIEARAPAAGTPSYYVDRIAAAS